MALFAVINPIFQPAMRIIESITPNNVMQGIVLIITTTFDHGYKDGLIVRLVIPLGFGMVQVNGLTSAVVVTASNQFLFFIDEIIPLDSFVQPIAPAYRAAQRAQVVPVGEVNASLASATQNVLPFGA